MTLRSDLEKALADEAYDGSFGALSPAQFVQLVARLAETAVEVFNETQKMIRCDYCGDALPSVPSRAHIPTTPDLQRIGFAADKIVCPECVSRRRLALDSAAMPAVLMHIARDGGALCGVTDPSHVTNSARYADCPACMTADEAGRGENRG